MPWPFEGNKLTVSEIDRNITVNRKSHHTEDYEHSYLIVRRGQPFQLTLIFNRDYNGSKGDEVVIQFVIGANPRMNNGSRIRLHADLKDTPVPSPHSWQVRGTKVEGKRMTVDISPSAEALIGSYKISVETYSKDEEGRRLRDVLGSDEGIIVLFNPWCKDDDVYLEKEEERQEYVLNENGRIWTNAKVNGLAWDFGQFEDVCLDAALYLLEKAKLNTMARANPVAIVRTLSALVNSKDEDGVLVGRWERTFPSPSTKPWVWTGSVAILDEYMRTKTPVRYGQCWVFAGLSTTLLRCLGIPTRSVTTLNAGRDTDGSLTIDYYYNGDGERITIDESTDFSWNFHVWTESWFCRPDLPDGYDGWQMQDGTPQETSDDIMRCGPTSVNAIKKGHVYLPYDTGFVFAEVNGDRIHWMVEGDGSMWVFNKDRRVIGDCIRTKAVGSNYFEDLLLHYKYKEGSPEEREAVHHAITHGPGSYRRKYEDVYDIPEPEVMISVKTPKGTMIGQDLSLLIQMVNTLNAKRQVRVHLTVMTSSYTGQCSEQVAEENFTESIIPKGELELKMNIKADTYLEELTADACLQVFLQSTVLETKRTYAHVMNIELEKPDIEIKVPEKVKLGEQFKVTMSFTNPLKKSLENAEFHIESSGIVRNLVVKHRGVIGPGERVTESATLVARRYGRREIVVRLDCGVLSGMTGSAEIFVIF